MPTQEQILGHESTAVIKGLLERPGMYARNIESVEDQYILLSSLRGTKQESDLLLYQKKKKLNIPSSLPLVNQSGTSVNVMEDLIAILQGIESKILKDDVNVHFYRFQFKIYKSKDFRQQEKSYLKGLDEYLVHLGAKELSGPSVGKGNKTYYNLKPNEVMVSYQAKFTNFSKSRMAGVLPSFSAYSDSYGSY